MKISVVMASYNGEAYITEQMDTLRAQTRPIDEALIFDDGSTDNTVSTVRDYLIKWKLNDSWKITVNPQNKGYRLNFLEGALHATGDIIFFCDQDDIWESNKIEEVIRCFENPNVMVVTHDIVLFNENGDADYRVVNAQQKATGKLVRCNFAKMCKRNANCGHAMAFRKSFRDLVFPEMISNEGFRFDEGLAALASIYEQYYILHLPLVKHRIHTSNFSTGYWTFKSRIRDIDRQIASRQAKISRISCYVDAISNSGGVRWKLLLCGP